MENVAYLPTFSYPYICGYNETGCPEMTISDFNPNSRTPTLDELKVRVQNEVQNQALLEIAIICDSISQGTAYDLLRPNSVSWITNGGIVMKNNIINKEKYEQISKTYDNFITLSIVSFVFFGLLALINPNFFPRTFSFTVMLVIVPGTIGLLIDKKSWGGKYQCQR